MRQRQELARALVERTWAMREESLRALADVVASSGCDGHANGDQQQSHTVHGQQHQRAASGNVAVVPIQGCIRPDGGLLEMLFDVPGGLNAIRKSLSEAEADDSVGAIVLDIDSPGGVTDGVTETAQQIRQVRASKPVVAAVNTMAASAAYWLASQASEVMVTPSGQAGSIGVFVVHENIAGMLDAEGVEVNLIRAGRYKAEANPWEPLSDSARSHLQDTVDRYYAMFASDVAKGRDVEASAVRGGFGEGRMLLARPAVQEGLADRLGSIDEAIARASRLAGSGGRRRGRADGALSHEREGGDVLASAVGPHETDTTDAEWDATANEQRLRSPEEPSYFRRAYAWRDEDTDGTRKGHWRFIHHEVDEGGDPGAANLRACRTAISILNGGRGVDPRQQDWFADREAIHRHLAAHLRDADEDPPPLQDLDESNSEQVELTDEQLDKSWARDLVAGRVPTGAHASP
jgi:signal peptide peptidase SppA